MNPKSDENDSMDVDESNQEEVSEGEFKIWKFRKKNQNPDFRKHRNFGRKKTKF